MVENDKKNKREKEKEMTRYYMRGNELVVESVKINMRS